MYFTRVLIIFIVNRFLFSYQDSKSTTESIFAHETSHFYKIKLVLEQLGKRGAFQKLRYLLHFYPRTQKVTLNALKYRPLSVPYIYISTLFFYHNLHCDLILKKVMAYFSILTAIFLSFSN